MHCGCPAIASAMEVQRYNTVAVEGAAHAKKETDNSHHISVNPKLERVVSLLCIAIGLSTFFYGISILMNGESDRAMRYVGFSLLSFGLSFDPINYIWLCLPFSFKPLYKKQERGLAVIISLLLWFGGSALIFSNW